MTSCRNHRTHSLRNSVLVGAALVALSAAPVSADIAFEYYRAQLRGQLVGAAKEVDFLLFAMPQGLGEPDAQSIDGTPSDLAVMDLAPREEGVWSSNGGRVSAAYASLIANRVVGAQATTSEDEAAYAWARGQLFLPPDPALLLRGDRPALRLTDAASSYVSRTATTYARLAQSRMRAAGIAGVIDALLSAGEEGDVKRALRIVDRRMNADGAAVWSERQAIVDAQAFPMLALQTRMSWSDDAGWSKTIIPASNNGALAVSVELKSIDVIRPWFDEGMFLARDWYAVDEAGQPIVVSTGGGLAVAESERGKSMLPLLPIKLVLLRHVVRIGQWTVQDEATLPAVLRPADSAAVGGSTIVVAGIICRLIPASPRPDRHLRWERPPGA